MKNWHSYNFEGILATIAQTLGQEIRPALASAHDRQQVDMMCLLLGQVGGLINDAAHNLSIENAELEALLRRSTPWLEALGTKLRAEIDELLAADGGDITLTSLSTRNSKLKQLVNQVVDKSFEAKTTDSLLDRELIAALVRANARRKPPMFLRGM